MNKPQPDRRRQFDNARATTRRAIQSIAIDNGAQIVSRPMYQGSDTTVSDVEPLPAMRAARDLELAARHAAHAYVRAAREGGHSWEEIGTALELQPNGDAQQTGDTVAEAAFTYVTGAPDSEHARRYGRTFAWTCNTCDNLILDHGITNHPADDEHGHGPACERMIKTIEEWDARWKAIEADWEAGQ
jgi:hypothetical protein